MDEKQKLDCLALVDNYNKRGYLIQQEIEFLKFRLDTKLFDLEFIGEKITQADQILYTIAYCQVKELANVISKYIEFNNSKVRIKAMMYLLGYMKLEEYFKAAIEQYEKDNFFGVQVMILFNLGYIINKVDNEQKKIIVNIILDGIKREGLYKKASYHSIINALNISIDEQQFIYNNIEERMKDLIDTFSNKYLLESSNQKKFEETEIIKNKINIYENDIMELEIDIENYKNKISYFDDEIIKSYFKLLFNSSQRILDINKKILNKHIKCIKNIGREKNES